MICRLRGIVRECGEFHVVMDVGGVSYQVFVAPAIMSAVAEQAALHEELELITYHYQQLEVGKGVPVLIGFVSEIEREFFERFITVSGIGPKAAVKALIMPIATIAKAIDEGNLPVLKSMPGIGEQRAKEIVAKLQGKVGKFALMPSRGGAAPSAPPAAPGLEDEAVEILVQLEYKKHEARDMVRSAMARSPGLKTSEDLLNEVYRQRLHEQQPVG